MATETQFTLKITMGDESQDFFLGARPLESIISCALSDTPEFAGFFAAAAQHPASTVRRTVASQAQLPGDASLALANDPSASVRVQLVQNPSFRRLAPEAVVLGLVKSDSEVAAAVAGLVHGFENADIDVLCKAIAQHPDPVVRCALAWNSGTPLKWLKVLRGDPTREVADTALREMAGRSR